MSSYTLEYAATRAEIWRWYWRAWARPAGLWRHHVAYGVVAAFAAALVNGLDWLSAAVLGFGAILCCIVLLPLWPQFRFKPQVRTLELDESGYRTTIGRLNGTRRWFEIQSVHDDDNTLVLTTRNGSAMIIPRRAFGEGIDRQRFVADIEAWHRRAAVPTEDPNLTWKGASVHVTSRIIGRYAWTTASIDVSVNGKTVLRSGGVMKITGDTVSTFEHEGASHRVALSWGGISLRSFPFRLEIDGDLIADSRVFVSNWWVAYWPLAAVCLFALLWRILGSH